MTLRSQITRLVARWRPTLALATWHIDLRFDEKKYLGTCRALPEYEEATLAFNLPLIRKELKSASRLEDLVVHELTHCLTWPRKKGVDEQMTTRVHRALLRAARVPV